jgi:allophanate hydrolase
MNIAPKFLRAAYRGGLLKPSEVMAHVLSRLSDPDQSGVWISTADPDAAMAAADALDRRVGEIEALPRAGVLGQGLH